MIPFSAHNVSPDELRYVTEVMQSGVTEGDGAFTKRASAHLASLLGGGQVLLTPSCTAALELSALLIDVGPGDEVVMPSYTFVSTANAFRLRGATVRFADIDEGSFSMGAKEAAAALTPKTKAVCAVHYGGVAPDVAELQSLCAERGIPLIEDNAHGLFAKSGDRPLGRFGRFSTLSFHRTKNISCGEGGALFVNEPADEHRAEMLREKGTDRSRFFRGEVDKYTWRDIGSSFLLSDLLAAVLLAQLEHAPQTQAHRHALWDAYDVGLRAALEKAGGYRQRLDDHVTHPAHVFAFCVPRGAPRGELMAHLKAEGFVATSHYEPLHVAPAHTGSESLPVTEDVARRLVRLPLHGRMSVDDAARAAAATAQWIRSRDAV